MPELKLSYKMNPNVHPFITGNAFASSIYFLFYPLVVFAAPYKWHFDCYIMIVIFILAFQAVDVLFSNATKVNLKRLSKEFSPVTIGLYYLINLLTFCLPLFLGKSLFDAYLPRPDTLDTHVLATSQQSPSWATMISTSWNFAVSHLSLQTVVLGTVLTVMSDFPFYLGHKYMHSITPELHVFHHCCIKSSTTTNLLFNPIDLFIEFSLPIGFMFLVSFYLLEDYWVFAVGSCVAQWWYAAGHDEALAFPHTFHHTYCNANYFGYITWWRDEIKGVKRQDGNREWEGRGDAVKKLVGL